MPPWRAMISTVSRPMRSTIAGSRDFRLSPTSRCCAPNRRKPASPPHSSRTRRAWRAGSRPPSRYSTRCRRRWSGRPDSSGRSCWCARPRARRCSRSCATGARRWRRRATAACAGAWTWTRRRCERVRIMRGLHPRLSPVSSPDSKALLLDLLQAAVRKAFPQAHDVAVELERPKSADHGDFATNAALQLAKRVGMKPRDVAAAIVDALAANDTLERAEIAGPGFINFRLAAGSRYAVVPRILAEGGAFGRRTEEAARKIMVEFVSANPTGPLHVGHGRQAALGDAISTLLE